jgi:type VI secretion system protein ImpF
MAERAQAELLQPALLDRLVDNVRLIDQELERLRRLVLPALTPVGREALARLIHPDRRPVRAPEADELAPFASLEPEMRAALLRLVEEEHRRQIQIGQRYALSRDQLKRLVLRDLERLLNTERLDCRPLPGEGPADGPAIGLAERFPHVAASIVNYGIPPLAGKIVRDLDLERLADDVATAIRLFEPRLRAETVEVRAALDADAMRHNTLTLEIEAELWAVPLPLRLHLRTQIDLESGAARVLEQAA